MTTQTSKRDIQISKSLSYLLRHGAVKEKLNINSEGYVSIDDILKHQRLKSHKTSMEDLVRIVNDNDKKRFTIIEDMICANQGHSIATVSDDNLELLTPSTIPDEIYHGTYKKKLPEIYESGGLCKMSRNHIHFTSSKLANISGIRYNVDALIYLNVQKCMDHGFQFYKSLNDVVLCLGDEKGYIGVEFFEKIVDKKTGECIEVDGKVQ